MAICNYSDQILRKQAMRNPNSHQQNHIKITRTAWAVSIVLHALVLGMCTVYSVDSEPSGQLSFEPPRAMIAKAAVSPITPVISPPKIIKSAPPQKQNPPEKTETAKQPLTRKTASEPQIIKPDREQVITAKTEQNQPEQLKSSETHKSRRAETENPSPVNFYENLSTAHKICYVVDASGSMLGSFNIVKAELIQSIDGLDRSRQFKIIFFGNGRISEFDAGKFSYATETNKTLARAFIHQVVPTGKTNAAQALKYAIRLTKTRKRKNESATIYFLTDGFKLQHAASSDFPFEICMLRNEIAPLTVINTIGFGADKDSSLPLQQIAVNCGGRYTVINN